VDGLIIENFHDAPYPQGPMDTAGAIAMAMLTRRIKQFTSLPIGISVLQNDPETALAIAVNVGAQFIRVSVMSGALLTDSGVINNRYNNLLHYQSLLKADLPPLLADISLNHLGPGRQGSTASQTLKEAAKSLIALHPRNLALIMPDQDIAPEELAGIQEVVPDTPVIIENKARPQLVDQYYEQANGLILEADTRKSSVLQPDIPPTIDMSRVEEIVNRLHKVVPVSEMDPDIFLKR
jgi:uncharacterized protein